MSRMAIRVAALAALCAGLAACAGSGNGGYAAVSCRTPGAVRESPFNSTANPTPGPLPRTPGDIPCYLPEGVQPDSAAHLASAH